MYIIIEEKLLLVPINLGRLIRSFPNNLIIYSQVRNTKESCQSSQERMSHETSLKIRPCSALRNCNKAHQELHLKLHRSQHFKC